ncbi:MAG TPA: hypothetical protein PLL30_11195 [Candidatus Krumholzibacteria bacterium]|nr:hypothetical protein [Candidatus Krumholzibacteria bacterium]HPD72331.1 hypothetical protein [Candidatus Krumholzibacteria bacterium]HRY40737.1 hypothetical protein [Candidatus Krumholzibacteria bacterium]
MRLRHLLFTMLLVAFAASGCIFSPGDDPEPPAPPPVDVCAAAPDTAMLRFQQIYSARNLDAYGELLSREYKWIPQEGEIYTYDVEIEVARKMFNALPGEGGVSISDISVDLLQPQGIWQPTPEDDPNFGGFPGSQYRNYIVDIKFQISGQNLVYRVQGPVLYYVMAEDVDGETCYKILGMVDATFGT